MLNRIRTKSFFMSSLVGVLAILISMGRRPNQINYPEVWVEEGTQFIPQFLAKGWLFLFEPVNGYLIIPPKISALIAYHISFLHYPLVSYVFALATSAIVAIAIYRAPTLLPHRFIAALVPFLIPFDPEPIGIGEYSFWFVGLLSVLGLIWQDGRSQKMRVLFILIGGISSPLGISILPLFMLRFLFNRNRDELFALLAAALTSTIQLLFVASAGASSASLLGPLLASPVGNGLVFITKFISEFFWKRESLSLVGIGALTVAAFWIYKDLSEKRYVSSALLLCAGISAFISILRVPLNDIAAMGAGPRYFFYPYIFLAWTMLAFTRVEHRQRAIGLAGALVLLNTATFSYRPHDDLDWTGSAKACLESPEGADLPVHYTGDASIAWHVSLTQAQCQKLDRISILP